MNSKRNWFSYLTWGIFIVLTGALYYFSFHELMDNSGLIDKKYVNLVLIMTAVIVTEAFIILNHAISRHEVYISDAKRRVFGIVSFVVSFGGYIAARLYPVITGMSALEARVDMSSCERALIRDDMKIFVNLTDKASITDTVLSVFFKFFGNKATAVIVANLTLAFLTAIVLFFAVKMLAGFYEACIVILIAGILPEFTSLISCYNSIETDLLFLSIGLLLLGLVKETEDKRIINEIIIIISAAIIGLMCLYNGIFYCLLPFLLVLLIENVYAGIAFRIINPILALIFFTAFFVIPSNMNYLLSGDINALINGIASFAAYRFSLFLYFEPVINVAKAPLMIVPAVMAVTYIVTFLKKDYDRIHAVITALIVNLVALFLFTTNKDTDSHKVFNIIFLAIIGGAGIVKLFRFGTAVADSDEESFPTPLSKESTETPEEESKTSDEIIDLNNDDVPDDISQPETVAEPVAVEETTSSETEAETETENAEEPEKSVEEVAETEVSEETASVEEPEPEAEPVAITDSEAEHKTESETTAAAEPVEEPDPVAEPAPVAETARFSEQEDGVEELASMDYEEPVLPSVSNILGKSLEEEKPAEVPEQFDNPLPLPKETKKRAKKAKKEIVVEPEDFDDNYDMDDIPDELMKYDIDF